MEPLKRENILIEALPYIREFHETTVVVKVGGSALVEPEVMDNIVQDVVLLRYVGIHPVIVHGGGPEITEKMDKMGKKPEFVAGLRVTDEETMEIVRMVLVGNVSQRIISLIGKHGGRGVSLSGKDAQLITARKKEPQKVMLEGVEQEVDLGWVGEIEAIDPEILELVAAKGHIPVISPIAVDSEGNSLNINADDVAADIAMFLRTKKLIMLTDVPGVLGDASDKSSLISTLSMDEAKDLLDKNQVSEGMIPKLRACIGAVEAGVDKAHILDGHQPHSILLELFTDGGTGTMVYR